ncbi:P-loop containing nucleoside triphosphate hydrolase protein [Boletus edulis BED1]|uniref:P-loop containing nucleoside triphosphate hydrolase protein n=1 Tax=Boletus edulis BED1 TaxID=1328754 RepID=A0AAD4GD46_BOLED|nr:P-loop containing nucleoside triphosphate hydrolase protein [Boletus edulis BED1]
MHSIRVMGITRVGKSSFINMAAGRTEAVVGNDVFNSQTQAVQHVRCFDLDGRRDVVLVDTPGFDNPNLSDDKILELLTDWLKETYQNKIKLSGLLYLHRILDNRMAGTSRRDLSVFKTLCGENNLKNVVLVTTMWDEVEESTGSRREKELLSDFWGDMIRFGSRTLRFQGTRESAWEIISCLHLERSDQERTPLEIQREMVDCGLQLHETTAAKTLFCLNDPAGEGETSHATSPSHQDPLSHPGPSVPDNLAVRGAQSSSSIDADDIVIAYVLLDSA